MAWEEQWTYLVDGVNINDYTRFFTHIPELDNLPNQDTIIAELAGDYPVYIRSQPRAAPITFNIAMAKGCTNFQWQVRLNVLRGLFTQGVRHQLTVQARGMTAAKSLYFIPEGMMTDFKSRLVSVRAVAPKPVLE